MGIPSVAIQWEASKRQPGQRLARIRFRHSYVDAVGVKHSHRFQKSMGVVDPDEAELARTTIVDTLKRIDRGLVVPGGLSATQYFDFLLAGGSLQADATLVQEMTLDEVQQSYFDTLPDDANEETTLATKSIHVEHLKRILGSRTPFRSIGAPQLQTYIKRREKAVVGVTIKKEIATFRVIWSYAKAQGIVSGEFPALQMPKTKQRPPFQTFAQIEAAIERGGLTEDEQEGLWDCLFLNESECLELLEYVKEHARHDFIVPLVAIAMFTGCRKGEVLRSEVRHWDLERGIVEIWSKKDKKNQSITGRLVQILPQLEQVMKDWLEKHPGGRWTIMAPPNIKQSRTKSKHPTPLNENQAHGHLQRTLAKSKKWSKLKGFHVLRHSFISICADKGIPQAQIDVWVGHSTEEQRQRYRHLFPQTTERALSTLSLFNGHTVDQDTP